MGSEQCSERALREACLESAGKTGKSITHADDSAEGKAGHIPGLPGLAYSRRKQIRPSLDISDLYNPILALAARRLHGRNIALPLADQGARNGRAY
jgi:hypothetical protein